MRILLLAEHDDRALADTTSRALSAAIAIGGEVDVLVAGESCAAPAEEACALAGVSKVLLAQGASMKKRTAEAVADVVVKLADSYDVVMAPSTATGKSVMPRVAGMLDVAQLSDVMAVHDAQTFDRPIYAGNAIETVRCGQPKKVMTVRTASFGAPEPRTDGKATVEEVPVGEALSQFVSEETTRSDRPELTSARVIISGGRGMKAGENFALLNKVADLLGAAVGASRAAVDAGYISNDHQVGQTGKVVAPDLYIAVGISGAIQHLAGMKDSRIIVAVNTDEEAPIFQVADYGLVADLFTALPELEKALADAGF